MNKVVYKRLRYGCKASTPLLEKTKDVIFLVFEIIAGLASISGILFLFYHYEDQADNFTAYLFGVIILLVLLTIFLVLRTVKLSSKCSAYYLSETSLKLLENELEVRDEILSNVSECLHNIIHESRSRIQIILDDIDSENFIVKERRQASIKKYTYVVLSNVKEIFDSMTLDNCAVCLKFLDFSEHSNKGETPQQTLTVYTKLRDNISFRERTKSDSRLGNYEVQANTAFDTIINRSKNYFISNDLQNEPDYVNMNERWKRLYNACIVVPIRSPLFENGKYNGKFDCIGFLAVDNKKGGFREDLSYNVLAAVADNMYHVLSLSDSYFEAANEK